MGFKPEGVSGAVWEAFKAKHLPPTEWLVIFSDEIPKDRAERAAFYAGHISCSNDADVILAVMTLERLRGASAERDRWIKASDEVLNKMRKEP